eukprot:SAG22_NODE_467_length_10171_cov_4.306295_15_plen_40_part_00
MSIHVTYLYQGGGALLWLQEASVGEDGRCPRPPAPAAAA